MNQPAVKLSLKDFASDQEGSDGVPDAVTMPFSKPFRN